MKNLLDPSCPWCGKPVRTENGISLDFPPERGIHLGRCLEEYERVMKVAQERVDAAIRAVRVAKATKEQERLPL